MELIQSKSLLAKLMATENLIVEQRKVSTASFDVKNRVLTVPILDKNISAQLYDLFMGHEVGHALYTPLDGMDKAREQKLSLSLMNVLEDVRIERKIKNKYPGIRQSFVRGYKELIDKNFFDTNGIDLNDLNFIDRINLFFKGGPGQGIGFTDFEKSLIQEVESTETYDDVIEVAKKVSEYTKQQEEEKQKANPQEPEYNDESEEDYDFEDDYGDYEEVESNDDWNSSEEEEKQSPSFESKKNFSKDEKTEAEEEVESKTDKAFRKNESQLFDNGNRIHYYGNIPDVDLNKIVIPYKKLWSRYREWVKTFLVTNYGPESTGLNTKEFTKIRNDSKKVVSYLAKEFEMRKNAEQMKRASVAKTGELNMEKIYAYKLSEDIFKKITVVPGGKSHGIVMFIDWSGSMCDYLDNTIKQLFNLTMFCKKVNLPFEVYAFTSTYLDDSEPQKGRYLDTQKTGDISFSDVNLLNLLSSKMSASELHYACSALLFASEKYGNRSFANPRPYWLDLAGTPLNETVIAAMKIVPQFKKDYKLQIVNTVFLSDGDGHNLTEVWFDSKERERKVAGRGNDEKQASLGRYDGFEKIFVIRDTETKNEERILINNLENRDLTAAYIRLLKKKTGCNVIGFYILSSRNFGSESRMFFPQTADFNKLRSDFRKNKYQVVTSAGYDEYYLLRAEGLDIDDDVEFEVKENATTRSLVTAFSKYTSNRVTNRVVLNRFVGLIT
jgi:hypothetical protein